MNGLRPHYPLPSRLWLTSIPLLAGLLAGCGITQSISPVYPTYLEALPFRAERPIARELRYTYLDRWDLGGEEGVPTGSADDVTKAALQRGETIALLSAQPPLAENWGDHYSDLADAAQAQGDNGSALMYRELAVGQAETQLAMNQISAAGNMLSTYVSVMSALAVAGQALMDRDAARLANWTATSTGAIGDEAPEGSILHLDFIQVLQGERFGTTSRVEFFATAILDDGNGTVFRSDRSYELFTYNPDDPPEDLPSDAVPTVSDGSVPVLNEIESEIGAGLHNFLAILANAAGSKPLRTACPRWTDGHLSRGSDACRAPRCRRRRYWRPVGPLPFPCRLHATGAEIM